MEKLKQLDGLKIKYEDQWKREAGGLVVTSSRVFIYHIYSKDFCIKIVCCQ